MSVVGIMLQYELIVSQLLAYPNSCSQVVKSTGSVLRSYPEIHPSAQITRAPLQSQRVSNLYQFIHEPSRAQSTTKAPAKMLRLLKRLTASSQPNPTASSEAHSEFSLNLSACSVSRKLAWELQMHAFVNGQRKAPD